MARVNISLPDDLVDRARSAGLNVSRVSAAALAEELDRRARIALLDDYLHELDDALGPVSSDEQAAAAAWADRELGAAARQISRASSADG